MSMYSVGDRVLINEHGHGEYGEGLTNPRNCFGTVTREEKEFGWVDVKWDNGQKNAYEPFTLDVVVNSLENV